MEKLKLPARVPNLGAHKLAWLVVQGAYGSLEAAIASFANATGGNPFLLQRVVRGEVVPVDELAADIANWSYWCIGQRDFGMLLLANRRTEPRWTDWPWPAHPQGLRTPRLDRAA